MLVLRDHQVFLGKKVFLGILEDPEALDHKDSLVSLELMDLKVRQEVKDHQVL